MTKAITWGAMILISLTLSIVFYKLTIFLALVGPIVTIISTKTWR